MNNPETALTLGRPNTFQSNSSIRLILFYNTTIFLGVIMTSSENGSVLSLDEERQEMNNDALGSVVASSLTFRQSSEGETKMCDPSMSTNAAAFSIAALIEQDVSTPMDTSLDIMDFSQSFVSSPGSRDEVRSFNRPIDVQPAVMTSNQGNETDEEEEVALHCVGDMSSVKCSLESKELWNKFNELGTEMIITKSGRYVFFFFKFISLYVIFNLSVHAQIEDAQIETKGYK